MSSFINKNTFVKQNNSLNIIKWNNKTNPTKRTIATLNHRPPYPSKRTGFSQSSNQINCSDTPIINTNSDVTINSQAINVNKNVNNNTHQTYDVHNTNDNNNNNNNLKRKHVNTTSNVHSNSTSSNDNTNNDNKQHKSTLKNNLKNTNVINAKRKKTATTTLITHHFAPSIKAQLKLTTAKVIDVENTSQFQTSTIIPLANLNPPPSITVRQQTTVSTSSAELSHQSLQVPQPDEVSSHKRSRSPDHLPSSPIPSDKRRPIGHCSPGTAEGPSGQG